MLSMYLDSNVILIKMGYIAYNGVKYFSDYYNVNIPSSTIIRTNRSYYSVLKAKKDPSIYFYKYSQIGDIKSFFLILIHL